MKLNYRFAALTLAGFLAAAAFVAPTGAQLEPLDELLEEIPDEIEFDLGDAYYESFDEDDGDWNRSAVPDPEIERPDPDNPQWEWGEPTSGPGEAYTGNKAWATKLDGPYESTCAALASPPIDLTNADSAEVSVRQWMESDESIIGLRDAGAVFVTTDGGDFFDYVVPEEGYDNDFSFNLERCFDNVSYNELAFGGGPDFDYREATIDLEDYLGEPSVQVVFSFGSRNSDEEHAGWYLDRFATTIDGKTEIEDFEDDDGGFGIMTTQVPTTLPPLGWEWGHPSAPDIPDGRNMWGTNLDGEFGHNECAWIESPPIDLGAPEALLASEATLQWDQFFRASYLTGGGVVQIGVDGEYTTIEPDDGYNAQPPGEVVACLGEEVQQTGAYGSFPSSPGSEPYTQTADISEFTGEEITIRFLFATKNTGSTSDGWYVDEVVVGLRFQGDVPGASGVQHPLWSADGDWDYGVPMEEGPVGQVVYGTNTRGEYSEGPACSILETVVDVPAGDLRWDQWVRSSSISAGGTVQVVDDEGAHVIVPEAGYLRDPWSLDTDECTLHESQDTGVMNGFRQRTGEDMETFNADLSAWAGEQVTLRFAWGVEDTSFTNLGWYVDNVVMDGIQLLPDTPGEGVPGVPDPEELVEEAVAEAEKRAGEAQAVPEQYPGWTVGGEYISWAHDEATTGPIGKQVTATNPHGVHTEESGEYECSYVQSPPVPTALMQGSSLSLDHYVEMSMSAFLGARTAGMILVSDDLGSSWEPLATSANQHEVGYTRIYDCFESLGVPAVDGDNRALVDEIGVISGSTMESLETLEVDLDGHVDADFLMVRLIFGTGTSIYAEGGWYFNNVQLGGVQLME